MGWVRRGVGLSGVGLSVYRSYKVNQILSQFSSLHIFMDKKYIENFNIGSLDHNKKMIEKYKFFFNKKKNETIV